MTFETAIYGDGCKFFLWAVIRTVSGLSGIRKVVYKDSMAFAGLQRVLDGVWTKKRSFSRRHDRGPRVKGDATPIVSNCSCFCS